MTPDGKLCPSGRGFALPLVVLLMLAATVLAQGLLALADSERRASEAGLDVLEARLAAEDVVVALLGPAGGALASDSVAVHGTTDPMRRTTPPGGAEGHLIRLSPELWLAVGVGRAGSVGTFRTARLAWRLDPAQRAAELAGVVTTGPDAPSVLAGTVDGTRFDAVPDPAPPGGCAMASEASPAAPAILPSMATAEDSAAVGLGRLDVDALLRRLSTRVEGEGSPSPTADFGACLSYDPWNWGDPGHPTQPCGGRLATVAADGDLSVLGGAGQGLLVVDGHLDLVDVDFHGMILATGSVAVSGSSRVQGAMWALGGLDLGPDASVEGSACWVVAALSAGPLGELVALPSSGWIGPW